MTNAPASYTADLRGLILWLETMEARGRYNVKDETLCVFGKFHRAIGQPTERSLLVLQDIYPSAPGIAFGRPRTFGAALERARKARARAALASEKT